MDIKNKAIEDALNKILQYRQAQQGGGSPVPTDEEDPRLKKPRQQNPGDKSDQQSSSPSGGEGGEDTGSGSSSSSGEEMDWDDEDLGNDEAGNGPQIGDRGDKAIQDAEEAERQANAYKEDAQNTAKNASNDEVEDEANDLADDAANVADNAKKLKKDIEKNGVGDEEEKRLQRIKDAFNDLENRRKALEETDKAVFTSRQLAADKKRRREYVDNPAARFIDSVQVFIRNQVADLRTPSWKRFSKRYVSSSPLIQKGRARTRNQKIPALNVYFDRSGSWDDNKIKVGQQAIAGLKQFERKGQLKINIYYFSDDIFSSPDDPGAGNSTSATQKILDHIEATNADNVIIMTDDDMDHQGQFTRPVKVDGAVWFVFVGGRCNRIMQYLKGKELTKAYELK